MKKESGIVRTILGKGCGFILLEDGSDIYFHVSGLLSPAFEDLKCGMTVEFMRVNQANSKEDIAIGVKQIEEVKA